MNRLSLFVFGLLSALLLVPAAVSAQDAVTSGIEIHGAWTIEVREPTGELVSRTDFTNDYVGGAILSGGLGLEGVLKVVSIEVTNCREDQGAPANCYFSDLPEVLVDGPDAGGLELRAEFTASLPTLGTAVISEVATNSILCPQTLRGDECSVGQISEFNVTAPLGVTLDRFTATTLQTPVTIADGQSVTVIVVLSFS